MGISHPSLHCYISLQYGWNSLYFSILFSVTFTRKQFFNTQCTIHVFGYNLYKCIHIQQVLTVCDYICFYSEVTLSLYFTYVLLCIIVQYTYLQCIPVSLSAIAINIPLVEMNSCKEGCLLWLLTRNHYFHL